MAQIQSGASSDLLTIDPGAKGARAVLYDASGNPISLTDKLSDNGINKAGIPIGGWNDGNFRVARTDRIGSLGTTWHNTLFHEPVEGAVLNTAAWVNTNTTFVTAQTATGINLNSTSLTTANAVTTFISLKQFLKTQKTPLVVRFRARISTVANSVAELGFGMPSGTTSIANGAYWQFTSGGAVRPVLTINGTDITGTNVAGSLVGTNYYIFDIIADDDSVQFTIQDSNTGIVLSEQKLTVPLGQPRLWAVTHLPIFCRLFNGVIAPTSAPVFLLTDAYVFALDANWNKPWPHVLASMGKSALYSPTALTQTAQFANSAAPTSATLSNTAAGYTTLGGLFQFAAVAGAVTDYLLFSFTVPSPYQLVVTGISIDAWNTGAPVAVTPTLMVWGLGVNGTAANLNTGAFIRSTLGSQSFPVGAAVGANVAQIARQFQTPVVCEAGRQFAVILRMPVGTATVSQIIQGSVNIDGYFE
jgi:hypothetical protein